MRKTISIDDLKHALHAEWRPPGAPWDAPVVLPDDVVFALYKVMQDGELHVLADLILANAKRARQQEAAATIESALHDARTPAGEDPTR